ncbi:MAG: fimbria major subunit [Muribaculaceae bacterium]|nr:fimbria major subunit [Muribaculaceae bacterium]
MNRPFDIWKWLTPIGLLLAVPFIAACGHEELVNQDDYVEEESSPYFELRIAMPEGVDSSSRSNPAGGEEGNGREQGILNEDKIHDINVFFYIEEDGKGMDSNRDTKIIRQIYFNIDNPNDVQNSHLWQLKNEAVGDEKDKESYYPYFEKQYLVVKIKCSEDEMKKAESATGLNFLVVANMGLMQDISTLGSLRSFDFSGSQTWSYNFDAFSKNAAKMDYFLMSTAYNKSYSYYGQPTGTNKITKVDKEYKGATTLQRMYARLDLWYKKAENAVTEGTGEAETVNELKYSVTGADGNTVYLTNVLPVNVMKTPSFLFKKVTAVDAGDNMVWNQAGLKGLDDGGNFSWGGKESPTTYVSDGVDIPTNYVMERHTLQKTADGTTGDLDQWYGGSAVAKVKEKIAEDLENNFISTDNGKFSAYYHGSQKKGYYDPASDCDHISIISYANENTHPTDCFHSNYLTGMAFRAVYVPAKIYSGYADRTLVEMTASDRRAFNTAGKNIYRYSPSSDNEVKEAETIYFSDLTALESYMKDHPEDSAVVTEFTAVHHPGGGELGFICYYNLWLRHYNSEGADPQTSYPMEYATVRNNIYRVSVSFRGPGDPTPTMREPDTMQARIFVRKWNYREEDTFYFD